ncbi:polysaccharide lyase family 8 super-sandwich domain-containing protein [Paenibacillus sp. PL2-23]|uniref:polysaccharide lyase family 8 super-sandwich domain-containing protein n=1 Tax=Paenibacillus sp. PL2-23 TaxID=2100729 RepID=UPI0030FB2F2E
MRKMLFIVLSMVLVISLGISGGRASVVSAADEYDGLRDKWTEMLNGGSSYNTLDTDISAKITEITNTAQTYWDSMNKAPSRTYLWSDLSSTTDSTHIRDSYRRLKDMALAYATAGSSLANHTTLKADLISALDWMHANRYYAGATKHGNWWDWEIGSPLALNDIVVLLYANLTATQISNYMNAVDYFSPDPTKYNGGSTATGANRVWKSTVVAVRAVIVKSSTKLNSSRDALTAVFSYVTSGDGFYRDGSFIQHTKHPYTGGYGKDLLNDLANVMYLLNGSTWAVTNSGKSNVYQWVYDSFEPVLYNGAMMDMTRGREISREFRQDHTVGHQVMQGIIRLSQIAPPSDAAAFKSMIKYWIQADTFQNFYSTVSSIHYIVLGKAIVSDSLVVSRGELVKHKQFPNMDRAVHLRPGFGFGISMHSSRVYNYESINSENIKGWHTADGMTYLYNADQDHYSNDFWPTVNSYRLPGTTVNQNSTVSQSRTSSKNWVGGTQLQQTYGVSGMELQPYGYTLQAKKSWFMFDDEIVAVGSGITSTDNKAAETIVENRKLNSSGNNALVVNGTAKSTSLGWSESMTGVNWMHLAGSAPGADIGYYFPSSTSVKGLREARTGSWSQVRSASPSTSITRNYMTLYLDHGSNPVNASYAYVLLPNKTSSQVSSYASAPHITVIEESADAHAVWEQGLNILGANFWNDTTKTLQVNGSHYLTSNKKASVMTKETASQMEISIADPTMANTGTIEIEMHKSASSIAFADDGITVDQLSPTIKLTVNVSGAKGKTFSAKLNLDTAPPIPVRIEAESYHAMSGVSLVNPTTDIEGGQHIGSANNGDYTRYDNVNFGTGASNMKLRIASNNSGGTIELRLNSTTGALIGSSTISSTGGWSSWTTINMPLTGATGTQTVYMVFKKSDANAVANVNWLEY